MRWGTLVQTQIFIGFEGAAGLKREQNRNQESEFKKKDQGLEVKKNLRQVLIFSRMRSAADLALLASSLS